MVGLLLFLSIISKLFGCWAATALSNWVGQRGTYRWRWIDTYLFGSSMVARGEVGLVVATVLYGSKVISPYQYVIAVIVIVLTTIAAPIMLGLGFHWLSYIETYEKPEDFTMNIGLFPVVGTTQMFNIIIGRLTAGGAYRTSVSMSRGRKIVNIEGLQVKIILCPDDGIILKGNKEHINDILRIVKEAMDHDVERLSVI
jgi:Kef-type K+ transport system membrane component KefB